VDLDWVLQALQRTTTDGPAAQFFSLLSKADGLRNTLDASPYLPATLKAQPSAPAAQQAEAPPEIPPAEMEWSVFRHSAQVLVSTLLNRATQEPARPNPFGRSLSAFNNGRAGSERLSRTQMFQKIVTAETAKVVEELLYGEVTAATSRDAQLASKTALAMSGQYLMMSNPVPLSGDPNQWNANTLPPTVVNDVQRLLGSAREIAQTVLTGYQDFYIPWSQQAIGTPTLLDTPDPLQTQLAAFEAAHPEVIKPVVEKLQSIVRSLFSQTQPPASAASLFDPPEVK
jgi:hypothetical protein